MITKVDEDYYLISKDFFENNDEWYGEKDNICYVPNFWYYEEADYWFTAQFSKVEDKEDLYYLVEEF